MKSCRLAVMSVRYEMIVGVRESMPIWRLFRQEADTAHAKPRCDDAVDPHRHGKSTRTAFLAIIGLSARYSPTAITVRVAPVYTFFPVIVVESSARRDVYTCGPSVEVIIMLRRSDVYDLGIVALIHMARAVEDEMISREFR